MSDTTRLAALEAVAEAAKRFVWHEGAEVLNARLEALNALDALPAQAVGEVVTLAVWEYPDGDTRIVRAGSLIDEDGFATLTRIGTVTLPLTAEVVR